VSAGAGGTAGVASLRSYSLVDSYNLEWKGVNGEWYPLSWGGNQYTGPRALATWTAEFANQVGVFLFYVGGAISTYQGVVNVVNSNWGGAMTNVGDIGVGAIGTWGGPYGAAFGFGYWLGRLQ
jgi:hypothetical protein